MPFLVVAGLNQTRPALGVTYSMLLLAGTTALAVVVTGRASRALLRRHGLVPAGQVAAAISSRSRLV